MPVVLLWLGGCPDPVLAAAAERWILSDAEPNRGSAGIADLGGMPHLILTSPVDSLLIAGAPIVAQIVALDEIEQLLAARDRISRSW